MRAVALLFVLFMTTACHGSMAGAFKPLQCVPYARDVSGIEIYGNAHTWWEKAHPNYARGKAPVPGSVLVLSKTSRLPYGHVAVVERVISRREIEVTHANWGQDWMTRRKIWRGMSVRDVSPKNDWSQLQFWVPESDNYGRTYAAKGFIYNEPTQTSKLELDGNARVFR